LMVAYLAGASVLGIQLSLLEIDVRSELDLAGFLATAADVPVQVKQISYVIRVAGDGTPEQFETLRHAAQAHSPNATSLATGVPVKGTVVMGKTHPRQTPPHRPSSAKPSARRGAMAAHCHHRIAGNDGDRETHSGGNADVARRSRPSKPR